MNKLFSFLFLVMFVSVRLYAQNGNEQPFHKWALTPPMGWNSWDCFGPSVVEAEVKANADYMATHLKDFGWEYVIVDIRWYVDNQTTGHYNSYATSDFVYDEYGRYMPSPTRFPSAADGAGFKPLADYVHNLGLKFGIHIVRGVPKEAVFNNLPIKGYESKTAADIYSTAYECTWLQDNYTVVAGVDGAQEYYNSILDLYAEWGVDYIKVDDLSRPYHDGEIEMLRNAIDQTGRPIVLSMSPGATPLDQHEHATNHANMWRTIDDFWDNWAQLNYSFGICANWAPYIRPGAWPDADMLPMGKFIRGERATDRYTYFTEDEQYTLMTLWTMFKSPLMFGGNLPDNDAFTNSLLTNEEVLEVHSNSVNNQEWLNENDVAIWTADDPFTGDKFVALFNNGGDGFISTKDLVYRSGTVSTLTDGYGVDIDVEIPAGSTELYLIVNDGGENYNCDHADWINPQIILDNDEVISLVDLDWEYATSGWSTVQKNKSISGGTLNVKGTTYDVGLGVHARSVVAYSIPDNTVGFQAFAGLDIGGTNQGCGSTVEFLISTHDPTTREVNVNSAIANSGRVSKTIHTEGVQLEADITGAQKLYLVVTDAGDGISYDHGDWINPAIYTEEGDSVILSDLTWTSATSGWASVQKNKSLDGNTLTVNGQAYDYGFGVNAYSIIEFDLPEGYTTFKSFCGYDDEVSSASEGVSIEFLVYTEDPAVSESVSVPVDLTALGFEGACTFRDLWAKEDLGSYSGSEFVQSVAGHGAKLYRVSADSRSSQIVINLQPSATMLKEGETLTLNLSVSEPDGGTGTGPTGWAQIMQNDSVIINTTIDEAGEIQLLTTLPAGVYTFKANYGGNTTYASLVSEEVVVTVEENTTSLNKKSASSKYVWVSKYGGVSYLNGLAVGDKVSVYDLNGKKLSTLVADSDKVKLDKDGFVIIEVKSLYGGQTLKANL